MDICDDTVETREKKEINGASAERCGPGGRPQKTISTLEVFCGGVLCFESSSSNSENGRASIL
jgi:hypothetical protein